MFDKMDNEPIVYTNNNSKDLPVQSREHRVKATAIEKKSIVKLAKIRVNQIDSGNESLDHESLYCFVPMDEMTANFS